MDEVTYQGQVFAGVPCGTCNHTTPRDGQCLECKPFVEKMCFLCFVKSGVPVIVPDLPPIFTPTDTITTTTTNDVPHHWQFVPGEFPPTDNRKPD